MGVSTGGYYDFGMGGGMYGGGTIGTTPYMPPSGGYMPGMPGGTPVPIGNQIGVGPGTR